MAKFVVEFGKDTAPAEDDGRLDAPAFHRNHAPIVQVLGPILGAASGDVIEIGSGTGQHVAQFARAFPQLTWWPSDPNPAHRRSIDAWRLQAGLRNIMPAVALDAAARDWGLGEPGRPPDAAIAAILCINVVHIAPWAVAEGLFRMAGRVLARDGHLILYGPFRRDGVHTAPSNAAFDASLRARDPAWGVRDTAQMAALAAANGLSLAEVAPMPANNVVLTITVDR